MTITTLEPQLAALVSMLLASTTQLITINGLIYTLAAEAVFKPPKTTWFTAIVYFKSSQNSLRQGVSLSCSVQMFIEGQNYIQQRRIHNTPKQFQSIHISTKIKPMETGYKSPKQKQAVTCHS